jgi:hypothetical protein
MTFVIGPPCADEDDVPAEWASAVRINRDFFAGLGSPGGASAVGVQPDHPQISALPSQPAQSHP